MAYNTRGYGMTTYQAVGDPFLGGLLKGAGKFIGGVAKTAGGLIGGPVGGILRGAGGILAPTRPAPMQQFPISRAGRGITGIPGFPGLPTNIPGIPTQGPGAPRVTKQGTVTTRKRPSMNPANPKALRRAIRREEAFVNLAKKALKGSKYTITTRGAARRPRRDLGAGHIHVR